MDIRQVPFARSAELALRMEQIVVDESINKPGINYVRNSDRLLVVMLDRDLISVSINPYFGLFRDNHPTLPERFIGFYLNGFLRLCREWNISKQEEIIIPRDISLEAILKFLSMVQTEYEGEDDDHLEIAMAMAASLGNPQDRFVLSQS